MLAAAGAVILWTRGRDNEFDDCAALHPGGHTVNGVCVAASSSERTPAPRDVTVAVPAHVPTPADAVPVPSPTPTAGPPRSTTQLHPPPRAQPARRRDDEDEHDPCVLWTPRPHEDDVIAAWPRAVRQTYNALFGRTGAIPAPGFVAVMHIRHSNSARGVLLDERNCVLAAVTRTFVIGMTRAEHAERQCLRSLGATLAANPRIRGRARKLKIICTQTPCSTCGPTIETWASNRGLAYRPAYDFYRVPKAGLQEAIDELYGFAAWDAPETQAVMAALGSDATTGEATESAAA